MNKIVLRGMSRRFVPLLLSFMLLVFGALTCSAADNPSATPAGPAKAGGTAAAVNSDQKKEDKPVRAAYTVKVLTVTNARTLNNDRAGIGENIIVKVDSLKSLLTLSGNKLENIQLTIDGKVIPGLNVSRTSDDNSLEYNLNPDKGTLSDLEPVFADHGIWKMLIPVKVGLAINDSVQNKRLDMRAGKFMLVRPGNFKVMLLLIGLVLFAITFLKLDEFCPGCKFFRWWKFDARLRDYGPDSTYSLARVQMAVWYYMVTMSFLYLYFTNGGCIPKLNESTIILIGISTMTKLSASVVDSTKKDKADKDATAVSQNAGNNSQESGEKEQSSSDKTQDITGGGVSGLKDNSPHIEAESPAGSKHTTFLIDILSDEYGINLTRFQNVVWTLVLVVIYITKVSNEASIPDFSDSNLLALMGISSGSYVLYKLKEAAP